MATNLAINDKLLNNALRIGGFKSKKDTVNTALEEFIQRRKTEDLIKLFGKVEFDPNKPHLGFSLTKRLYRG